MPTEHQSLKGQLLLDGGKLVGSFFHRTVVLICQHDAEGAFGLVLNRVSGHSVREVLVADMPARIMDLPLFVGGPVQPTAMSYLHSEDFLPEATVLPNLNLGHSLDDLGEIGESYSTGSQLKLFAGYAGWSAGQLDGEMKRGAWLTHPADLGLIFHPKPEGLWTLILRRKGSRYRLLADSPDDLSVN
ncbi:MAG: YqgE/AlgH family protein [Verrucomicrobiales bacterium]|nr:YqgE/AlgH family protein [Verrucomicrobiales bacterium]MCP5526506.1 YqgE/AlgH family protein [Verrucomicrobiales bacterium]